MTSYQPFDVVAKDNAIEFKYGFDKEQEYVIRVVPSEWAGKCRTVVVGSVYALDTDLYKLQVAKGELHMHTTYSDGLESPDHRLVQTRKNGFDFAAVTDHSNYNGSLRAISILERIPNNMVCIHGEEVHADFCPVHILSLGANRAITPEVVNRTPERKAQLYAIQEEFRSRLTPDVDSRSFSSAIDVFRKIKEAGGLSVLCHIYWDAVDPDRYMRMGTPEQLVDALVRFREFDAFEITSGAPANDLNANYLQEAYYREKLPEKYPIIGVTDSHTTDETQGSIFGKNYTIAFAEHFSEEGILDAVRQYRTVSVDRVSGVPICHGSLRLCKYAAFLLEHYFPMHDNTILSESICMERILAGDTSYLSVLEKMCKDNTTELVREWGHIVPFQPICD